MHIILKTTAYYPTRGWIMSDEKEISITYETLFEILRREKGKDELQKLSESFFDDLIAYLKEKQDMLESSHDKGNLFASGEKEKTAQQLSNVRRILKELYDRREKKLINTAINMARTNSNLINTSAMLNEERVFFECIVDTLTKFRKEVLFSILEARSPEIDENFFIPKQKKEKTTKMVRFLHAVPKFVGKELEVYGPFVEDDIANLPAEIADILLKKGRADEIEEE